MPHQEELNRIDAAIRQRNEKELLWAQEYCRTRLRAAVPNDVESEVCGCFYCLEIFPPSEIEEWTDDEDTALCPKCGIDSVIGSVSGYPIEREFLKKMHDHWF